jgi:hypothetical protein
MDLLARYEQILSQGLTELGPVQVPQDEKQAAALQVALASVLGDALYRLSIEHGVGYNPFRETVISLIADKKPALASRTGPARDTRPFAAKLSEHHALILLALEIMPPDTLF